MNNEKKPEDQIYRLDSKSSFVECLNDSFHFDQAHLRAIRYDKTNEAGNRITDKVDIYASPERLRRSSKPPGKRISHWLS